MFKYEIHLHSAACSACAFSDAREYVDAALENGYAGMVFTNHFYHGNTAVSRHLSWRDFVGAFRDDYLQVKEYGDQKGIDVLFGIEEVYEPGSGKEILIYGISPEDLISCPEFLHYNVYQMSEFVRSRGGYVVCAHPFRVRDYIPDPTIEPDPSFMDAVEIYNYANAEEDDEKAVKFAKKFNLPGTAGGDVHKACNFGHSGLAFYERIRTNEQLVYALKNQRYRLICEGEIQ